MVVEYTQIIDRFSVTDAESPAFKSAFGGQWPSLAARHAEINNPHTPNTTNTKGTPDTLHIPSLAAPIIISVVVKSAKLRGATADQGVEIHYAVTALHTSKEALQMVLNKAVTSGYFTQALRQSGYPHAEAKQALLCTDVTPTPNPKSLTIVEVNQVVDGISVEEANSPGFRAMFNDSIATSTMVSPEASDVYQVCHNTMARCVPYHSIPYPLITYHTIPSTLSHHQHPFHHHHTPLLCHHIPSTFHPLPSTHSIHTSYQTSPSN